MKRRLAYAAAAIALALSTSSGAARAEPAGVDEGRARFSRGVTLFRAGEYRAALVEFNKAYAAAPSHRIQFNIGQTCVELQDYACAFTAFEKYLAEGGSKDPPARRHTAEGELRRLRALVGRVNVVVDVDGAEIAVDDVRVGESPLAAPALVTAGRRKISASKGAAAPVSRVVDVAGGETLVVTLAVAPAKTEAEPPPKTETDGPPNRTPVWIGVGITGVLTAATVTFGVLTLGAKSDVDETVGRFGVTREDVDRARSKQNDLALATDVLGGATLVAAGITAVLFATMWNTKTRVAVGPLGVWAAHAF
ncbi:MAG: hypothetical protein KF819_19965 [Labilithrix sp.]|nr:hypothetical protein [Labilithrix sp.]